MVCFDGGAFGMSSFEVCTQREITCDGECTATVTLGTLTALVALYDAYSISHCELISHTTVENSA